MNNKGNRKHLTFEQRVEIEKALTENKSFAEIGRIIGKDSSTISKEVRLHARVKERPDPGYTNPPCIHRKKCKMTCLCDEQCGTMCKICKKQNMRCIDVCPAYETAECEKLKKPPYVCNGCAKKSHCLMPRMFYSSKLRRFSGLYKGASRYQCRGNGLRGRQERRKQIYLNLYIPQLQSYAHVPFGISGSGMRPGGLCMAGNSFGTGGIQKAFSSDPYGWRF